MNWAVILPYGRHQLELLEFSNRLTGGAESKIIWSDGSILLSSPSCRETNFKRFLNHRPLSRSLMYCQFCKNRDGGLFLCPNCRREYPHTELPGLLLSGGRAIVLFALDYIRPWWTSFLDNGRSTFAGVRARLGKRSLATGQPPNESLSRFK